VPHSYSQSYHHIVFSTKERQKLISKPMQPKLWSYMAGIGRNHGFLVLANGGMEDHAHLLIQLPSQLALAQAISLVKANSSRWMNEHAMKFSWQEGYGAFSVSASNLGAVERYIANQEQHHRKITYEQEFVGFSRRYGIEFDPQFVFG
jgi:putative transposase